MTGLSGKVLVTGGTGSLGRALLTRAEKENWNCEFFIFNRDESKQAKVKAQFPKHKYYLGDIAKYPDISSVVRGIRPDIIAHFAALKRIPTSMEQGMPTVETNIIGSMNVIEAALEYGVAKVVATSTDKACWLGINLYGASKNVMEHLFKDANKWEKTQFHLTRYGNILASTGSVYPFFRSQVKRGGPVTVTMGEATRFWLDLNEGLDLVLLALAQEPGVIVIPKAGAMSMEDFAKCVIGDLDIKIQTIGLRSGEKIHEHMISLEESMYCTQNEKYFFFYPYIYGIQNEDLFSYSSDNPNHWLTNEEILQKVQVSHSLGS